MSGGEEVGELEEILADGRAHIGQSKVVQKVVTDLKVLILMLTLLSLLTMLTQWHDLTLQIAIQKADQTTMFKIIV